MTGSDCTKETNGAVLEQPYGLIDEDEDERPMKNLVQYNKLDTRESAIPAESQTAPMLRLYKSPTLPPAGLRSSDQETLMRESVKPERKASLPEILQPLKSQPSNAYLVGKRIFDILAASILLLALFPVFLLVALAIFIEDPGPILYCQPRTGKDGKAFPFFKFRSMVRDADALKAKLAEHNEASGPIFKMQRDPRITKVGRWIRKYSIDELPQLVNVVRGEMSLVGPRPLPTKEAALCNEHQWKRHSIQPGLLCLREVCGRSSLTFDRWMELDLLYIECRCVSTDLRILIKVLPAVLRSDGAY